MRLVTCHVLRSITATWLSPFTATNERDAFDLLARRRVEDDEVPCFEVGDERELAVGRELDPVRSLRADADRLQHFLRRHVDDRHPPVARVRAPDLLAVRRQI